MFIYLKIYYYICYMKVYKNGLLIEERDNNGFVTYYTYYDNTNKLHISCMNYSPTSFFYSWYNKDHTHYNFANEELDLWFKNGKLIEVTFAID